MTRSLLGRDIVTGYGVTRSVSADTWTKIASGSMTAQYQDWSCTLLVTTHLTNPSAMLATVYVNDGASGAATGSIEMQNINTSSGSMFRTDDLVLVFTSNVAFALSWELYLKFPAAGMDCEVMPLNILNNGGVYQFYEEGALVGSLPAGVKSYGLLLPWHPLRKTEFEGYARSDTEAPTLYFSRARIDAAGIEEAVADGDLEGVLSWWATAGGVWSEGAKIRAQVYGVPGSGDLPTALVFSVTADTAGGPTDRWLIHPSGILLPLTPNDIGTTGLRAGSIYTGTLDAATSIVPSADGAAGSGIDLGSSSRRFRRVNSANLWQPFAYHLGFPSNHTGDQSLVAVAAGVGGALIVPMELTAPMLLQSISVINANTASLRTCDIRLYADNRTPGSAGALDFVTGTDCSLSFTPTVVSHRVANVSGAPVYLPMGMYWVVIRNSSTSQTFNIRLGTFSSDWIGTMVSYKTTTAAATLGATIDPTAWVGQPHHLGVRLNGRVFGQTTAFTG